MKVRNLIIVIGLCVLCNIAYAQEPDWLWAKSAGGTEEDLGNSITTDCNGNSYIVGSFFDSANFGSITLTSSGYCDVFIAKTDTAGNWIWAKRAGGTDFDKCSDISQDANGNLYITGYFSGTATFGSTSLTSCGNYDIFVAKMDTEGNWLWASSAGGPDSDHGDYGKAIITDANGDLYVTGMFNSAATFGSNILISNGESDIFVAKIDTDGNWLWAKQAGGSFWDYGLDITTDADGNSYVTGMFFLSASFGSITITGTMLGDIFVAKIDADGNWIWAKEAGGGDWNEGYGIDIDANGNLYITGFFGSTATFGSTTLTSNGYEDIFLAKMDANGNWLWAKGTGGNDEDDRGIDIITDTNGNSYVTGYFSGSASFGSTTLTSSGNYDIFVAEMDADGNWILAKQAGGSSNDEGTGISLDNSSNSYITGAFQNIANFGNTTLISNGDRDIFVAKIGEETGTSVDDDYALENRMLLLANYPNPFNPQTTISYSIPHNGKVSIEIYNIRGQRIKTLINNDMPAGYHSVVWDGKDENGKPVSSEIYLYKLKVGDKYTKIKKMILLK